LTAKLQDIHLGLTDPDFAMVAELGPELPAAIKAGIVAMVRTTMRTGA
jgi:hypothetical protein